MHISIPALITITLAACSAQTATPSKDASKAPSTSAPCDAATGETLMNIQSHENNVVSICRQDGLGDCFYSASMGKTFESSRPDLNDDGHTDIIVKDFTGVYGNHEIVHFLGYVACPSGGHVKVLDSLLTSAQTADVEFNSGWKEISVTRDCFDDASQAIVSRRYTLRWSEKLGGYGPPDDDPDLADYCTDKELQLPATR